jgi:hypothetical protein
MGDQPVVERVSAGLVVADTFAGLRSYVYAAYSWRLKSEHDYRSTSQRRFRLVYNPAAGIPTEPKKVGTRCVRFKTVGWRSIVSMSAPFLAHIKNDAVEKVFVREDPQRSCCER